MKMGNALRVIGRSKAALLLLGESGTGKEVIARAIHDTNPVGNFVPIDCGSQAGPTHGERAVRARARGLHRGGRRQAAGSVNAMRQGATQFETGREIVRQIG
jgi:DNA-binding NtrC family response regulator